MNEIQIRTRGEGVQISAKFADIIPGSSPMALYAAKRFAVMGNARTGFPGQTPGPGEAAAAQCHDELWRGHPGPEPKSDPEGNAPNRIKHIHQQILIIFELCTVAKISDFWQWWEF